MKNKEIKEEFILKKDGKEIERMILEMFKSGGFDYGIGNSIELRRKGEKTGELFDARYDSRFDNEKSFRENAYGFIKERIRKEFEIEKV